MIVGSMVVVCMVGGCMVGGWFRLFDWLILMLS